MPLASAADKTSSWRSFTSFYVMVTIENALESRNNIFLEKWKNIAGFWHLFVTLNGICESHKCFFQDFGKNE